MAKVEIKQPIVDEIAGYLADAQAMVLVDYRGLPVEEQIFAKAQQLSQQALQMQQLQLEFYMKQLRKCRTLNLRAVL